jgi:hypothetical protein
LSEAIEWNLFKDATYLDACESSDLHTFVAKLTWPNLPWTGDPKADKNMSLRQSSTGTLHTGTFVRRLGHGSNFEGRPQTLSDQTGVPLNLVTAFQPKYFDCIPVSSPLARLGRQHQVAQKGHIVGITGRKRWFMGRRTDPDTVRQAIAYDPQASRSPHRQQRHA